MSAVFPSITINFYISKWQGAALSERRLKFPSPRTSQTIVNHTDKISFAFFDQSCQTMFDKNLSTYSNKIF